jgi:hypothetical protein
MHPPIHWFLLRSQHIDNLQLGRIYRFRFLPDALGGYPSDLQRDKSEVAAEVEREACDEEF